MSQYLLHNRSARGGVSYGDNAIDHVRISGYTYGGTNASIQIMLYDKDDNLLLHVRRLIYDTGGNQYAYFGNISYGGPWTMTATRPCTDGTNNYEVGQIIRQWGYDSNPDFTLYHQP